MTIRAAFPPLTLALFLKEEGTVRARIFVGVPHIAGGERNAAPYETEALSDIRRRQ